MAENVHTGGVMQFRHEGGVGKLDDERKALLEQGYREAEERKKKERKRNRMIWILLIILICVILIIYFFLRMRGFY